MNVLADGIVPQHWAGAELRRPGSSPPRQVLQALLCAHLHRQSARCNIGRQPRLLPLPCRRLAGAVQRHLAPLLPANGAWLQDSRVFHSTIYHASTHTVSGSHQSAVSGGQQGRLGDAWHTGVE